MKSWKLIIFLMLTLLVFISSPGLSEEEKQGEKQREKMMATRMNEVVVTATRSKISVFDAPQSVTVISREEIMASSFDRWEDIVRSVVGMYNYRHYAVQTHGIASPLKMRGVGEHRILILVDGVPQNNNFNNAIAWVAWGHIPKQAIERIEIVRGPASAIYGSEGLGGVINIITKKPKTGRQSSVEGEIGTADTYKGDIFHSQKIKNFGFLMAGGYEDSDGFYMVKHHKPYEIKRDREVRKVFGKLTYDLTYNSNLSLAALYYDHQTGKGRRYFYDDLTLGQYWMNYTYKGKAFDLKGLVYINQADKAAYQDTAKDNYSSLYRKEEIDPTTWGADFQGNISLNSMAKLTLGVGYKETSWDYDNKYVSITRKAGAEGKQRFISPFANLDFHFFDNHLIVTIGGRYDWIRTWDGANWDTKGSAGKPPYHNDFDSETEENFSPKVGIAWHPDNKTTIRASAGKGFRAPSLFELYKVHVRGGGTYYRNANPDLDPEKIWSYDIGVERILTNTLWGRVTFYQSFAKDYIGDRLIGTATFSHGRKTRYEYKLDNISDVDIYGVEAELEWYALPDLTLFANYTFNVSKIDKDKNNPELEDNYLPYEPRHQTHFGFHYNNPNLVNVSVTGNYYTDIYFDNENTFKEDDYFTMDVSMSRQFFNFLTAFINIENLFDEEYPIFKRKGRADTIAPGTIISGGLKFTF
ncbi:TonB-dependent receptor [Desulfothermus naphthae]